MIRWGFGQPASMLPHYLRTPAHSVPFSLIRRGSLRKTTGSVGHVHHTHSSYKNRCVDQNKNTYTSPRLNFRYIYDGFISVKFLNCFAKYNVRHLETVLSSNNHSSRHRSLQLTYPMQLPLTRGRYLFNILFIYLLKESSIDNL